MVRDGYFYGLGFILAGVLVGWFAQPAWALVPLLLAVQVTLMPLEMPDADPIVGALGMVRGATEL